MVVIIPVGSFVTFEGILCEVRDILSPDELVIAGYEPGTTAYLLHDVEDGVARVAADDELIMLY